MVLYGKGHHGNEKLKTKTVRYYLSEFCGNHFLQKAHVTRPVSLIPKND